MGILRFVATATVAVILWPAVVCAAPGKGFPPAMPLKDRTEILSAAGYDITSDGRTVFIYCDEVKAPINPGVLSLDLTGDGEPDYVLLGQRACPGSPPSAVQTDIVSRRPDGVWQDILSVQGTLKPGDGATDGWHNLIVVNGARTRTFVHDRTTERYANVADLKARNTLAIAAAPTHTPSGVLPTAGWPQPYSLGDISPGDLAAILLAAGYRRTGGKWTGCDGQSEVHLYEDGQLGSDAVVDLNGDGQPEVMVYDDSSECYGDTGSSFNIVTPIPGGWKRIFEAGQGVPEVRDTRSKTGWRDIVAAGPGFCHELYRYNGKAYVDFKQVEETKGACAAQ